MMVDFLRRDINNRLRTITISIIHHVFQVNWRIYGAALVFLYKEDLLFFGKQSHPCVSKWTTYLLIIASILDSQLKSLYIWFSSFSSAHVGLFFFFEFLGLMRRRTYYFKYSKMLNTQMTWNHEWYANTGALVSQYACIFLEMGKKRIGIPLLQKLQKRWSVKL